MGSVRGVCPGSESAGGVVVISRRGRGKRSICRGSCRGDDTHCGWQRHRWNTVCKAFPQFWQSWGSSSPGVPANGRTSFVRSDFSRRFSCEESRVDVEDWGPHTARASGCARSVVYSCIQSRGPAQSLPQQTPLTEGEGASRRRHNLAALVPGCPMMTASGPAGQRRRRGTLRFSRVVLCTSAAHGTLMSGLCDPARTRESRTGRGQSPLAQRKGRDRRNQALERRQRTGAVSRRDCRSCSRYLQVAPERGRGKRKLAATDDGR
jgi:hypothetical protein